jgi:hypothetical protein
MPQGCSSAAAAAPSNAQWHSKEHQGDQQLHMDVSGDAQHRLIIITSLRVYRPKPISKDSPAAVHQSSLLAH